MADSRSDLDVAMELEGGPEALSRLAVRLSRAAGREVDLVSLREAPPLLRFEIARDGIVIVERTPLVRRDVVAARVARAAAWLDAVARAARL